MDWSNLVVSSVVQEFFATILGVGVAFLIRYTWIEWCYGRWVVIIKQNDKEVVNRAVSPGKAKMVLSEEADLSVYLKGIISPYCQLREDLIAKKSKEKGLLIVDKEKRQFIVDLDKTDHSQQKNAVL